MINNENEENDEDDTSSIACSSLSSHSDHTDLLHFKAANNQVTKAVTFSNGIIIKSINENVLLEQAHQSLSAALKLIQEANNSQGSWIDARELLDQTAAALDDAGLALRDSAARGSKQDGGRGIIASASSSLTSGDTDGRKASKNTSTSKLNLRRSTSKKNKIKNASSLSLEDQVRALADQVIDQRRSLLGSALVHDADGIWTKTVYGEAGDGLSFGFGNDTNSDSMFGSPITQEEKDERPLILWASQTGTAKKFAKHLYAALDGPKRCVLHSLQEVSAQTVARHKRIYIVCSTFGCGRPPRGGELFYSLLQLEAQRCKENYEDLSECGADEADSSSKPLQGQEVVIASLGSSAFRKQHFAKFGFGLASELQSLGATMIKEVMTIDAAKGKTEQKESFRRWENMVVDMEKGRDLGWVPTAKATKIHNKGRSTTKLQKKATTAA